MTIKFDTEVQEIINEARAPFKLGKYKANYDLIFEDTVDAFTADEIVKLQDAGAIINDNNLIIPANNVFELKPMDIIEFGGVDIDVYLEDEELVLVNDSNDIEISNDANDIETVGDETAKFAKQGYDALEGVIRNVEAYGERNAETSNMIDLLITTQEVLRNMVPELQ